MHANIDKDRLRLDGGDVDRLKTAAVGPATVIGSHQVLAIKIKISDGLK